MAYRDRHGAVVLPDGRVLIVGGVDTELVPLVSFSGPAMPWILSSTEILDPRNGHFSAAASMIAPRDEPTATLLRNGKVLVVGGGVSGAELYDPKNNTFAATGTMAESRYGQTATLLKNGKVLICGGGPRRRNFMIPSPVGSRRPAICARTACTTLLLCCPMGIFSSPAAVHTRGAQHSIARKYTTRARGPLEPGPR